MARLFSFSPYISDAVPSSYHNWPSATLGVRTRQIQVQWWSSIQSVPLTNRFRKVTRLCKGMQYMYFLLYNEIISGAQAMQNWQRYKQIYKDRNKFTKILVFFLLFWYKLMMKKLNMNSFVDIARYSLSHSYSQFHLNII